MVQQHFFGKYLSTKINEFKHYSFDTNVQINDT